jgi:hypothetical protein
MTMEHEDPGPTVSAMILLIGMAVFALSCVFVALFLSTPPARAHSFYPWECCSDQDCWPMGDDADAKEPEPRATPAGWLLTDGSVVPYREARPSPDGRFHVCRRGGASRWGGDPPLGQAGLPLRAAAGVLRA